MHLRNKSKVTAPVLSVVLASVALTITPARAQVTIDDFGTATVEGLVGSYTLAESFDASGSDKLVVTISMERDRGDPATRIVGVTYNGVDMIEVIQFKDSTNYEPPGIGPAAIFYLDDPGPAGPIVAVGSAKMNSAHGAWLALSGTAPGVGPSNGSLGTSTSITTTADSSIVIAHNHVNEGTVPAAEEPLIALFSSNARYSEAAAGYQIVEGAGTTVTPTFTAGRTPVTVAAAFEAPGGAEELFDRGDVNADGTTNIADAIALLGHLFSGGAPPVCPDTADANDDGRLNIADAIAILGHLFGGAGPLPAPSGACGPDPTDDALGACNYPPANCR